MSRQHDVQGRKAFYDTFLNAVRRTQPLNGSSLAKREKSTFPSSSLHEYKDVFSESDVIKTIRDAKKNNKIVRVRGSEHSPADHILDVNEAGILLTLKGDLQNVTIDKTRTTKDKLYVTAGGGCLLGYNPNKDDEENKNSLCYVVNEKGFALPALGGITHQTVAGFLSTGSAGGSLKYSFTDIIEGITFIDGNRKRVSCSKDGDRKEKDLFYAAGVSMGLFGVITEVTFCIVDKAYYVKGTEENVCFDSSHLGSLDAFLKDIDEYHYWRFNWFPQVCVNVVMQWIGKRPTEPDSEIKPYKNPIDSMINAIGAASVMCVCNTLLYNDPCDVSYLAIGAALRAFCSPCYKAVEFYDIWCDALPMDNKAHVDDIIEVDFTEVWIPIDRFQEVINKLKRLYEVPENIDNIQVSEKSQKAAGNFAVEIYPAKESEFWLSMSYGHKMIRVDPYWFHHNPYGDAREYFTYVWDTLLRMTRKESPVRLHWGKYLPIPGQKITSKLAFNLDYLKSVYPKMEDWLKLREEHDPDQVFVSNYWKQILEIS